MFDNAKIHEITPSLVMTYELTRISAIHHIHTQTINTEILIGTIEFCEIPDYGECENVVMTDSFQHA